VRAPSAGPTGPGRRAAFEAETGKATAKVVHTAGDAADRANDQQWHSTTVAFTPTFLVTVRGEPGADGVSPWRVIVGRGEPLQGRGKYNTRVGLHPLVVDPDSGTAWRSSPSWVARPPCAPSSSPTRRSEARHG
jgi:hypothetical protein